MTWEPNPVNTSTRRTHGPHSGPTRTGRTVTLPPRESAW